MNKRVDQEGLPDDAKTRRKVALGKLLREARHAKEWVLADVAKRATISVPFLSDLERGKRAISPRRLHALCRALELSDAAYVRVLQLRQRLPPPDEKWFLSHAELWPSRKKGSSPPG